MDAGAFGARLGPKDAYRFAKGEEVIASSGQRARLSRPLDFLVVSDHSDGMGFFPQLVGGDPALLATPQGRKWYDEINSGKGAQAAVDIVTSFGRGQMPKGFPTPGTPAYRSAWREIIKAADEANEPGRFTAFIGYEWTSNTGGNNLHRNVIWRDNGAKASLVEPFTTLPPLGSPNPRDLWKWMAMVEEKTGAEILALAHNGNLSNGRMFPIIESFTGRPIDREYAENRVRWEPLYEATQIKGDGQLVSAATDEKPLPSPDEMAETALQALALPDIAALRPFLVPEMAVWATRGVDLVAGRADALAIRDGKIDVAIDWKSDVNPTPTVRKSYVGQLRDYLDATGAPRGALVFITLGEVVWVESAA
jgi:hypothetical protein